LQGWKNPPWIEFVDDVNDCSWNGWCKNFL